MRNFINLYSVMLGFCFFLASSRADVKIGDLPLGLGAATGINDSLPYVNATSNTTQRIRLYDLPNIPAFQTIFSGLSSPLNTKGDLFTFNGASSARFAACGNGSFLKYDSTSATGLSCGTASASFPIQTATNSVSIAIGQFYTVANCPSSCTLTLPAASTAYNGTTTSVYSIKKIGAGFVTIATSGTDTIDGSTTAVMSVVNTTLSLFAYSTGWLNQ